MNNITEITAELIETTFGSSGTSSRFVSFCNAVIFSASSFPLPSFPIVSEKPGADGGFDAEWQIPINANNFNSPFAEIGWNTFQFKARSISGNGRSKTIADLQVNLSEALKQLVTRLEIPDEPKRYVLFTNLQLGLRTRSKTANKSILSRDRNKLESAIRKGSSDEIQIEIVDAAQLATLVNQHPGLRLTYFEPALAKTWDDKWHEEQSTKNYKGSAALVGRRKELQELNVWIADASVKVIAVCGPSGMGKTRLALEGTKDQGEKFRTTIIEDVDRFERWPLNSFKNNGPVRIFVVEDPNEEQALRLAKQAVTASNVKIIFTFPSEQNAPQLKLTDHESVRQLSLEPLNREDSRQLLKDTGAQFDTAAFDWIIQQAGGVPEILLSAAELGAELRDKSGALKAKLAEAYSKRIKKKLGSSAISLLRVLSLIHWVKLKGDDSDYCALITIMGPGIDPDAILNELPILKKMGYVKERGDYVSVVPPLFAAAFVEEIFATKSSAIRSLFDMLNVSSQKRMLERCIASDISDDDSFWDHILRRALGNEAQLLANLELLGYLARAIPVQTARFLEIHIHHLSEAMDVSDWRRGILIQTIREIAYSHATCATGLNLIQILALQEPFEKEPSGATELFCECFVHWNSNFPMNYPERERVIRRLLNTGKTDEKRLAARIVKFVTVPPSHLSGYTVQARRLTQPPPVRYIRELQHFLANILDIRFELTQDVDTWIASVSSEDFVRAFDERYLPPSILIPRLEILFAWRREGKIGIDTCAVRARLDWIEETYVEVSTRPDQQEHARKWAESLERIRALILQLDKGDFETRLVLALGTDYDHDWEEKDGVRVYAYEIRAKKLAEEAIASPALLTNEALQHFENRKYHQRANFVIPLGELDEHSVFFGKLVENAKKTRNSYVLGLYLLGVHRSSPLDAESKFKDLFNQTTFDRVLLPEIIRLIGPTKYNREALVALIESDNISPIELGEMFMSGRWLDDLPAEEVLKILEHIYSGSTKSQQVLIAVISLYLHPRKALPRELIPFVERLLAQIRYVHHNEEHRIHSIAIGIAKTDLSIGFAFLRTKIDQWNKSNRFARTGELWMPFSSYDSNDFWHYLRKQDPERAYRELLSMDISSPARSEIGLVLDLELHRDILLRICGFREDFAVHFSNMISGAQKGFFEFAYSLMSRFPDLTKLNEIFTAEAIYQVGNWDFANDMFQQALSRVEDEIASEKTPKAHLPWLESLKETLRSSISDKPDARWHKETLGWD